MKIIILISFIIPFCSNNDLLKIKAVQKYLDENPIIDTTIGELSPIISNQIVRAKYFTFDQSKLQNELSAELLAEISKNKNSKQSINHQILKLNNQDQYKGLLFFSQPTENTIMIEVFVNHNNLMSYKSAAMFSKSLIVLFIFKENVIQKVFKSGMTYN